VRNHSQQSLSGALREKLAQMTPFEAVIQQNNAHTHTGHQKGWVRYNLYGFGADPETPVGCCNYKIGSAGGRESFPIAPRPF